MSASPDNRPPNHRGPAHPTDDPRRDDILRTLHGALRARRRRRAVTRITTASAAAAAMVAIAAITVVRSTGLPSAPSQPVVKAPTPPLGPTAAPTNLATTPAPTVRLTIRHSSPVVLSSCDERVQTAAGASPESGLRICLADDDQFLAVLAETGEQYGLIRRGGRVEIVRNTP